jgi:hypothetical protein
VPENERSESGKLRYSYFKIIFYIKDLPLAKKLIGVLGYGTINIVKNSNYCVLNFYNKEGVLKIIHLINGKMRTPKIEALHRMIILVNKSSNLSIPLLPLDTSSIGSNAWFSGYVDADGSFEIVSSTGSNKAITGIKCRFRIEQRQNYHKLSDSHSTSYQGIMEIIALFFNGKLTSIVRVKEEVTTYQFLVRTSSKASNSLLDNYFKDFPLFSGKYLDYSEWSKVHNMIIQGEHLTHEGSILAQQAKESMNTKRSSWNWDHLSSFYTN